MQCGAVKLRLQLLLLETPAAPILPVDVLTFSHFRIYFRILAFFSSVFLYRLLSRAHAYCRTLRKAVEVYPQKSWFGRVDCGQIIF